MVTCLQTTQNQPKNSYKPADFRQILKFTCGTQLVSCELSALHSLRSARMGVFDDLQDNNPKIDRRRPTC